VRPLNLSDWATSLGLSMASRKPCGQIRPTCKRRLDHDRLKVCKYHGAKKRLNVRFAEAISFNVLRFQSPVIEPGGQISPTGFSDRSKTCRIPSANTQSSIGVGRSFLFRWTIVSYLRRA
jgi:hypothetical protein